jgi:hypothetical protein
MSEQSVSVAGQPAWDVVSSKSGDGQGSSPRSNLFSEAFTFWELSWGFALGTPLLYLLLFLIEVTSYVWKPFAVFLYAALFAIALLMTSVLIGFSHDESKPHDAEFNTALAVLCGIAALACFSQASKHLYALAGGFSATGMGYWHWMRFGCSNFLEAVLFDIPDVYDWNVSEIHPSEFWSRTILLVFRTSLEFMVVAALLHAAAGARKAWSIPVERQRHRTYAGHLFWQTSSLVLAALWGIPLVISVAAVQNDGFSLLSSWTFTRLALPVGLGAWLAWQSLTALSMPGMWNKVFAILGAGAGGRLVYVHWHSLSGFFATP